MLLEMHNITKKYKDKEILKDISLKGEEGQCIVFLGENGAGKSTLLKIILGIDKDYYGTLNLYSKNIGYVPECVELPHDVTVLEYLHFIKNIKKNNVNSKDTQLKDEINFWELDEIKNKKIGKLSKGNRQQVAIIAACLGENDILVFDEPMSGLDPLSQYKLIEKIKKLITSGKLIIMSCHFLNELEKYATNILIFEKGIIKKYYCIEEIEKIGKTISELYYKIIEKI